MVKDPQWQDYTATYKDSDGDEHESKVTARRVEDGEDVPTIDGVRHANSGDFVVKRDRTDVFDVVSADDFQAYAGKAGSGDTDKAGDNPNRDKSMSRR